MHTPSLFSNLIIMGLKNHIISPILGNMKSVMPSSSMITIDGTVLPETPIANDNILLPQGH